MSAAVKESNATVQQKSEQQQNAPNQSITTQPVMQSSMPYQSMSPYGAMSSYGGGYSSAMPYQGLYGQQYGGVYNGMNGMQPPQQGFRHEYQGVLTGLQSLLNLSFASFGLVRYGRDLVVMTHKLASYLVRGSGSLLFNVLGLAYMRRIAAWLRSGSVEEDLSLSFQQFVQSQKLSVAKKLAIKCIRALRVLLGIVMIAGYVANQRLQQKAMRLHQLQEAQKSKEILELAFLEEENTRLRNEYEERKKEMQSFYAARSLQRAEEQIQIQNMEAQEQDEQEEEEYQKQIQIEESKNEQPAATIDAQQELDNEIRVSETLHQEFENADLEIANEELASSPCQQEIPFSEEFTGHSFNPQQRMEEEEQLKQQRLSASQAMSQEIAPLELLQSSTQQSVERLPQQQDTVAAVAGTEVSLDMHKSAGESAIQQMASTPQPEQQKKKSLNRARPWKIQEN